ncbi:zinc finger protein 761-like [Ostrinia nubilalis]|uniref:zinc finger protein 761-like n=1 Tax=Ostrinia nubilalis TaxID=29057 RepID=UPI00308262FC
MDQPDTSQETDAQDCMILQVPAIEEPIDSDNQDPMLKDNVMNMFTSVWVKVEMEEESPSNIVVEPDITHFRESTRKKQKPLLKCDVCDYTTTYKNCLKLHKLGHGGVKPNSCELCDYTTKYPTALNRHMAIKHQSEEQLSKMRSSPNYKCGTCDYTTYYKWNLNAHMRKHKDNKQFQCSECDYTTAYRHNFLKHSKTHNDNMVYKCDKCPFVTKYDGHITRHMAKIHNEVSDKANKCEYCDFSTKVNWRLTAHKVRSKQKEILKCESCDFETYYMCENKKHKRTHTKVYKKNQIPLEMEDQLTDSLTTTNKEFKFLKEENEKAKEKDHATHNYMLDGFVEWKNIQVLESENKDRPFLCHMCNYTSRFKASVQRHFQRHHTSSQIRPYKCVNCDFATKTKDQIALHNKRSESKVPMSCNLCQFTTNYKCQYVMHQKSHYEYKCTKCEYICKHKYEMQKHVTAVHLGDGFKCQYCGYLATRKENLLSHETTHTGVKPFHCTVPQCGYRSIRKTLLRNHMARFHGDIKDDVKIVSDNKIQALKLHIEHL